MENHKKHIGNLAKFIKKTGDLRQSQKLRMESIEHHKKAQEIAETHTGIFAVD